MKAILKMDGSFFQIVTRFLSTEKSKFGLVDSACPNEQSTFLHKDLVIRRALTNELRMKPHDDSPLKFGKHYSDHMIEINWTLADGWTGPRISPFHSIELHPGAKVLHYAVELFEGLKAYRGVDGVIRLFRPNMNMHRMRITALRSAFPGFNEEELLKVIIDLVKLDQDWVPHSNSSSLYIRPTMIATDSTLGVGCPDSALLFVLTGPVGEYYETGFQPVSLLADPNYVRASTGGVGSYKMGCNYAPTIMVGKMAEDLGCQQVLWLFGLDEKLTEVGTMNIFVFWINEHGEQELVTPPLDSGLILPGVTRNSMLHLAREWDEFKVSERDITMGDLCRASHQGRILEMFGSGTACVVSPVGHILYKNRLDDKYEDLYIPTIDNQPNLMNRFYDAITGIQYGRIDKSSWTTIVTD